MTATAAVVPDPRVADAEAVLRLEQRLLQVTGWLDEAGIPSLVLKGAALAHLDHPSPAARTYGDVDLLLRGEDLAAAEQLLAARGHERRWPALRPLVDRRFGKGITMVAPDDTELDLHRTLVDGTFGLAIDVDELWATAVPFELGGRRLWTIDREHRLLHACLHAALNLRAPDRSVRDVAVLLAHPAVDHDLVASRAEAWGVEAVVARAVALVEHRLGTRPTDPTSLRYRGHVASTRDARAIATYTERGHGHLAKVLASLPYLDSWRDRVLLVWGSLVPSRAFLAERGGLVGWWRHGWQAATRLWAARFGTGR